MADPTRPGVVYQGNDYLEQRIRRLEEMVDELSKKDLSNATVGQGGRIRGLYANGNESFVMGRDTRDLVNKVRFDYPSDGSIALQIGPGNPNSNPIEQEQFVIRDQSGGTTGIGKMFATDGLAGYGLAEPSFQHFMATIYGLNWVAGTPQIAARSETFLYNPSLYSSMQLRNFAGGVTSASCRLIVTNGNGDQVVSSATAVTTNNQAVRIVLLPASFMNAQNLKVEWEVTTTGSGTLDAWPRVCKGMTKAIYDIRTDIQ